MGEIEIEFMGRDIGTFCHEAHVAQGAGIHDGLEIGALNRVELTAFGLIDHIEEFGEGIAQIEAATAAVTDIEDAAQFRVELLFIEEIRLAPFDRVACRGIQAALSRGGSA
jgi:hypothetical protein